MQLNHSCGMMPYIYYIIYLLYIEYKTAGSFIHDEIMQLIQSCPINAFLKDGNMHTVSLRPPAIVSRPRKWDESPGQRSGCKRTQS